MVHVLAYLSMYMCLCLTFHTQLRSYGDRASALNLICQNRKCHNHTAQTNTVLRGRDTNTLTDTVRTELK